MTSTASGESRTHTTYKMRRDAESDRRPAQRIQDALAATGRVAELVRNISTLPGKEGAISPVAGGKKGQLSHPHPQPRLTDFMSGKDTSESRVHAVDVCMTATRKR